MYIETQRMMIRDFVPEDAKDLYEMLGDDETMKNLETAYSFEKTAEFLEKFCIEKRGAVAAVSKESGKMIGYILFNEVDNGVYEIGWIFNRNYRRCGYAYESCKAVVDYAFDKLYAHKIFAEAIDRIKSVGLMQKLGMKPEGVQRSHTKDMDGNWTDLYLYGLLREDRIE